MWKSVKRFLVGAPISTAMAHHERINSKTALAVFSSNTLSSVAYSTNREPWVERYGIKEVRQWNFEVWNEPDLRAFWTGTQRDHFKLYRYTAGAIKEIDSSLNVGGPAPA